MPDIVLGNTLHLDEDILIMCGNHGTIYALARIGVVKDTRLCLAMSNEVKMANRIANFVAS